MGKLAKTWSLAQLECALRRLGEEPSWKDLPNTQRQHSCRKWKAVVNHYSGKNSVLVQGAEAELLIPVLQKTLAEVPLELSATDGPETPVPKPRLRSESVPELRESVLELRPDGAIAPLLPVLCPHEVWHLYVDGSCPGNQKVRERANPAGWGVAVRIGSSTSKAKSQKPFLDLFGPVITDAENPLSLGAEVGSNNTAEVSAFGEALHWLRSEAPGPASIPAVLHYDSKYAWKVVNAEWAAHANVDLVMCVRKLLHEVSSQRTLTADWVRGHTGDVGNESADLLANKGVTGLFSSASRRWSDQLCKVTESEPPAKRQRLCSDALLSSPGVPELHL